MILCESTPTERAAYVSYLLARGRTLTTNEAAELTGVSVRAMQIMLNKMARTIPIYREDNGRWTALPEEDAGTMQISPF